MFSIISAILSSNSFNSGTWGGAVVDVKLNVSFVVGFSEGLRKKKAFHLESESFERGNTDVLHAVVSRSIEYCVV